KLPLDALEKGRPLANGHKSADELASKIRELNIIAQRGGGSALVETEGEDGACLEVFHCLTPSGGVTTILDITEQKRAEEALRRGQKLESLGKMTGGVAHDFNILLPVIIGCLSLLRSGVGRNEKALERIEMATMAAQRGARLTKQLLAFARRQPLRPEII